MDYDPSEIADRLEERLEESTAAEEAPEPPEGIEERSVADSYFEDDHELIARKEYASGTLIEVFGVRMHGHKEYNPIVVYRDGEEMGGVFMNYLAKLVEKWNDDEVAV